MGRGFCIEARQKRITLEDTDYPKTVSFFSPAFTSFSHKSFSTITKDLSLLLAAG